MKRAIVSDIHGNLAALTAVLADIKNQAISEVYCLGDLVVFGNHPGECVDLAMKFDVSLMGNHDYAVLCGSQDSSPEMKKHVELARTKLNLHQSPETIARRWDFLMGLPSIHREANMLFVHGSPRDHVNEYVFPEDIYNQRKMEEIFSLIEKVCFLGHTHLPGVFTQRLNLLSPEEIGYEFRLGDEKNIINVGSVGQPRDGDPRSCYVVLTEDMVQFRRVEYDVQKTA